MPAVNLTMSTLAARMCRSTDFIVRHWRRLVEREGFPPPLKGFDQPVWSIRAVEAWEAAQAPKALHKHLREAEQKPSRHETDEAFHAREDEIVAAMGRGRAA